MKHRSLLSMLLPVVALCGAVLAPSRSVADPPKPPLVGRVLDERGTPMSGVTVARGWLWDIEKKGAYSSYGSWIADAKGWSIDNGEHTGVRTLIPDYTERS